MSASATQARDTLRPFQLDRSGLRGRILRLDHAIDGALAAHGYPDPVARLLAELLVLAGALAGGLKFDGSFSLQARGDGPVRLLVADCTNRGVLRAYASYDEAGVAAAGQGLGALLGQGLLALTVDQTAVGGETYQGIVALDGETLGDCMLTYFRQSEQVATGLRIAAERDEGTGAWRGGGIVVQALPPASGEDPASLASHDEDAWRRTMILLGTVEDRELLDRSLSLDGLLWRLFNEEEVRVFEALSLESGCRCSADRFQAALASFPLAELREMAQDDGVISTSCRFCGRTYRFAPDEVGGEGTSKSTG